MLRNELCKSEVQADLESIVRANDLFRGAPFSQVSVFIHLGEVDGSPEVGSVTDGVVEVAIARRFAAVRHQPRAVVCDRIRAAASAASAAALTRHGIKPPPSWHREETS